MAKEPRVDPTEVRLTVLRALATGTDPDNIQEQLFAFRRRHDVTTAEVLLELAADALQLSGATREQPVEYTQLIKDLSVDYEYRGRSQWKAIRYALTYPAARAGGLDPDFLDEVPYLADELWIYAFHALLAYLRAASLRTGEPPQDLARRLADRHGLDLH